MTEQVDQALAVGGGKRRPAQRGYVRLHVMDVAGSEQHHVDTGFVAGEAVGGVGQAEGTALVDEESEGIGIVGQRLRHLAGSREIAHRGGDALGLGEDAADGRHQQRADSLRLGSRQNRLAGMLVHHVESEHHRVPMIVLDGAAEHLRAMVAARPLGEAEEADFTLLLFAPDRRQNGLDGVVVVSGLDPVELEDVDMVGAQQAERGLQAGDDLVRRQCLVAIVDIGLGGNHHLVAGDAGEALADHTLGAVGCSRVEQGDAEIKRAPDQRHRFRLALAGGEPEPAEPTAAEAGDTDLESGAAKCDVIQWIGNSSPHLCANGKR